MKFTPKKDSELTTPGTLFKIFPAGDYDFTVVKAIDKVSMNGNEMIALDIDIYSKSGDKTRVFDYLLDQLAFKLKHFCYAVGLENAYEEGTLTADMCSNRAGKCKIGIKKDKNGEWPDRNVVIDYCCGKEEDDIAVSDIPF